MMPGVSSPYAAQREMLTDVADGMRPFLRQELPASCRPEVSITSPPAELAMVVHLGVEELPLPLEARLIEIMETTQRAAAKWFPTIPLTLEVLRPPLNRYGFVAHLGQDAPEPVYPRIVAAKAHVRMNRSLIRKGVLPWLT